MAVTICAFEYELAYPEDRAVRAKIADGARSKAVAQTPSAMLPRVVAHVTGLAKRREVAQAVVAGIVVEVRVGEDHAGSVERQGWRDVCQTRLRVDHGGGAGQQPDPLPPAVAPAASGVIPSESVAQMHDVVSVRSSAMLPLSLDSAEADQGGQLRQSIG